MLGSAVRYDLLTKNPLLAVQIPRTKVVNKKKQKPHITPEEFERLVEFVDEPYATMIYVAVFSGLRVSELVAIRLAEVDIERCEIRITQGKGHKVNLDVILRLSPSNQASAVAEQAR